jgi:hypothetical protein
MPSYLDSDGLANYFPPRDGEANRGSDTLTAYLLAATHEAASINPAFALSDDVRAPMERGLIALWRAASSATSGARAKDLDMRKLAALEALSRYGKARAACWAASPSRPTSGPRTR